MGVFEAAEKAINCTDDKTDALLSFLKDVLDLRFGFEIVIREMCEYFFMLFFQTTKELNFCVLCVDSDLLPSHFFLSGLAQFNFDGFIASIGIIFDGPDHSPSLT